MQPQHKNNLIAQISAVVPQYCDKCGQKHGESDLEVMSNDAQKVLCRLHCKNCGANYLIHVNNILPGVLSAAKSPALKTDITDSEADKFAAKGTINGDDLIDVHKALKSVETIEDFNRFLGKAIQSSGNSAE